MAIRKRSASVIEQSLDEETIEAVYQEPEPMLDGFQPDNVIPIDRDNDLRGTFDRRKDPFPGSLIDAIVVGDRKRAGAVVRHIAFTNPDIVALPSQMRVQDLLAQVRIPFNERDAVEQSYRDRVRSPLTAIRAFCVESQGGSPKAVRECEVMECPFWPFRMGRNTMRGRS